MRKQRYTLHVQDNKLSEVPYLISIHNPFLIIQHLWSFENTDFVPSIWRPNLNIILNNVHRHVIAIHTVLKPSDQLPYIGVSISYFFRKKITTNSSNHY
jgi:hypothetical protein